MDEDCDIEFGFLSPTIYEAHRRLHQQTGTVRKNKEKTTKKLSQGNDSEIGQTGINGVRGVMSIKTSNKMSPSTSVPEPNINLSREELLKLLSVFEGELQARDEVIEILKSERTNNPAIQERYGLSNMPMQALQRDAATLDATTKDHVAEQTKENLQKIIQHQKESYKKLKQAMLAAEQANQRLAAEIMEEKRKHQDYMLKSDDFVNLVEEERERLKLALDKERAISEVREREVNLKFKRNKDELSKLKSLSIVLVEERQQHLTELTDHKKQVAELERRLKESEAKCKQAEDDITQEKEHSMQLENDLEQQTNNFFETQEDSKVKLGEEQQKNHQLEEKVKTLTQQLKKLKCVDKDLRKTDDQLWRIHEKLEKDEEHDILLEEVELLRQRVKDMEEAENIYTQAQEDCKDIRSKLEEELTLTRSLRSQLKTIQAQVKNQKDLQRSIEDTDFRFDELQLKFDFEQRKSNDMREQLQKMKSRMTELDDYEKMLRESEEKMHKMREHIVSLANEKKCVDNQVKFLIDKNLQQKNELKVDKEKVTGITERLIQESKKALKLKEEFGQERLQFSSLLSKLEEELRIEKEKNQELASGKQTKAEEANDRLRRQVIMLKTRLDQLENENEQKEIMLKDTKKPQEVAVSGKETNPDLVDIVKNLKATEERCEQLAEQLHAKSKLCEDLKKQLVQATQVNNNCSLKGISVEIASTQTDTDRQGSEPEVKSMKLPKGSQAAYSAATTVKKMQTNVKTSTRVSSGSSQFNAGNKFTNSTSKSTSKPPISPTATLSRSTKATPAALRLGRRTPPSTTTPQTPIEVTFTHDVEAIRNQPGTKTATIKIMRDEKTGTPIIKTSGDGSIQQINRHPNITTNSSSEKCKLLPTKLKSPAPSSPKVCTRSRNLSKTRENGKQVTTKDSMSPTRIPKYRTNMLVNPSEPFKSRQALPSCRRNGIPK